MSEEKKLKNSTNDKKIGDSLPRPESKASRKETKKKPVNDNGGIYSYSDLPTLEQSNLQIKDGDAFNCAKDKEPEISKHINSLRGDSFKKEEI